MQTFFRWLTGTSRPSQRTNEQMFLWQRPTLIDPPLRPLPSSRPRRLTGIPGTQDQHQSMLIACLPAEVRVLIWEHALGGENDVLHLELADGTLRHNRCYQEERQRRPCYEHDCWTAPWRKSWRSGPKRGINEPENHRRALLPLLLTCKLMCVLTRVGYCLHDLTIT